jgi:hypothetical protein
VHVRGWSPIGNDKKNGKKKEGGGSGRKYPTGTEGEEENNVKERGRGERGRISNGNRGKKRVEKLKKKVFGEL